MFRKGAYRIIVIAGALAVAYLATAITLSNVVATRAPRLALALWPSHAVAHARMADVLIGSNGARPPVREVRKHAAAALSRNPTLASPARDLGLLALLRRDMAEADRRLSYAEAMSRRDIPTQLWLIERRVAANDVPGALLHYGVALQVAPGTSAQLFPVLAAALGQDDLVRPIGDLVLRGESWRSPFFYYVNANATNLSNLAALYLYLNRRHSPPERVHVAGLIGRLLQAGELDAAARVYAIVDPAWRRGDVAAQLDGGFDRNDDLPPFGWALEPSLAWRSARAAGNADQALYLSIPGSAGWASTATPGARRLLLLPAGAYRLTALLGREQGAGQAILHVELACAQGSSPASAVAAVVPARPGPLEATLRTGGCGQQNLSISVERQGEGSGAVWIDRLRLTPTTGN
jgi:hypothetical protein